MVGPLLRLWMVVRVYQEVGQEPRLAAVVWGQEEVLVRVSLADYKSSQKDEEGIHAGKGTPCDLSPR